MISVDTYACRIGRAANRNITAAVTGGLHSNTLGLLYTALINKVLHNYYHYTMLCKIHHLTLNDLYCDKYKIY